MTYWVYILASRRHGTLYVGMTNSLERRVSQHVSGSYPGFTAVYGVKRLVWFREFGDVSEAIHFEKQLKRWKRDWKVRLIETDNSDWEDIYAAWLRPEPADLVFMGPGVPLRENRDDRGEAER